jgi:hypothetical protein
MKMGQCRRVLTACFISVFVNIIWLDLDASTIHENYPPLRTEIILKTRGSRGDKFADWLAPPGHDIAHFFGGFLLAIVFSFVFYATLAWIIISLPAWWHEIT